MPFKAEKEKLRREAMQQIKNQRPQGDQQSSSQPPPSSSQQSFNRPNYQDLLTQQQLNQNRIDGHNQMYYNQQVQQVQQSNKKRKKFRLIRKMNTKVKELNMKQKQKRLEKQEEDKMNLSQEDYIMKYANKGKAIKGVFITIFLMFILYLFYTFFK